MALNLDLSLTEDELVQLGANLRGCKFTSEPCRRFLQTIESCDVQAAPGSGKTTLLVAKLLHARRRWRNGRRGICVLSHTNAARREVENRLSGGEAADLLGYPNFVGTITKFITQYIALPYLRGLGWSVTVIDDDIHAARATGMARDSGFLRKQWERQDQFAVFADNLTFDPAFHPMAGAPPERIPVADQKGLPKAGTSTRTEFENIKGRLIAEGVFRYSDVAILAERGLDAHPLWAELLAERFPLVLVDEVQDSQIVHLRILDRIFGAKSCVQRLGDCNQTIFDAGGPEEHWKPKAEAIDLGNSLRFGSGIAGFSSRLTLRRKQVIGGFGACHDHPVLLTFPDGGATRVMGVFARMVTETCQPDDPGGFWVVASRHRPAESGFGMSLVDYWPTYLAPTSGKAGAGKLHAVFRDAAVKVRDGEPLFEHWSACCVGVGRLLRIERRLDFEARLSSSGILRRLEELSPGAGWALREVVRGQLTRAATASWSETKARLIKALDGVLPTALSSAAHAYLEEAAQGESPASNVGRTAEYIVGDRRVLLRLGSIASVKGQTHAATLVVQTKRGQTWDVKYALEVAAEHRRRPTSKNTELIKATTNIFVGATRPRRLLCLALPETDLSAELRQAVEHWGWSILDCGNPLEGSTEGSLRHPMNRAVLTTENAQVDGAT